jgi:hypothetical protein
VRDVVTDPTHSRKLTTASCGHLAELVL